MGKSEYRGNLSPEELKELEAERLEVLKEREAKKKLDIKRRQQRGNRHHEWEEIDE